MELLEVRFKMLFFIGLLAVINAEYACRVRGIPKGCDCSVWNMINCFDVSGIRRLPLVDSRLADHVLSINMRGCSISVIYTEELLHYPNLKILDLRGQNGIPCIEFDDSLDTNVTIKGLCNDTDIFEITMCI